MKKIFLSLITVLATLSCFSQTSGQVDLNKLFEEANKDYQTIMKFPHNQYCELFLYKYKNVSGLDSVKSQTMSSYLKDVEDIYSNTDWSSLKSIHYMNDAYLANSPKRPPYLQSNATDEMRKKNKSEVASFDSLQKKYELDNQYTKDVIKAFKFNKKINEAYLKAIESNKPDGYLVFRNTFNSYRDILLNDRDSLIRNRELYFNRDELKDYYLKWIGFENSNALYEKARPSILQATRPLITETLKSDETKLSIADINEFATPFMKFNHFSNENHSDYARLWFIINKDSSPSTIISLFGLGNKYSTPLQKENFQNSTEYTDLKTRKDSLRSSALSRIYITDLERTNKTGELDLGGLFMISGYDMTKNGFTIGFNPYELPGSTFNDPFSTTIPKVVNRICFESIPMTKMEEKPTTLNTPNGRSITGGTGYNLLFIPTDKVIGGKIEEAGDLLGIKILFQLDEELVNSGDDKVMDFVKAKDCKLLVYNTGTSEILYSKWFKAKAPVAASAKAPAAQGTKPPAATGTKTPSSAGPKPPVKK